MIGSVRNWEYTLKSRYILQHTHSMKRDDYIPLAIKPLEKQHTNFLLPIGFYIQDVLNLIFYYNFDQQILQGKLNFRWNLNSYVQTGSDVNTGFGSATLVWTPIGRQDLECHKVSLSSDTCALRLRWCDYILSTLYFPYTTNSLNKV